MHAPFHVRPAASTDALALTELGPRTFRDTFGGLLPEGVISSLMARVYALPKVQEDLVDPCQHWFVAEGEEVLVGFLSLRQSAAPDCVTLPRPLELHRLYLDRAWHGRGPGLALLHAGMGQAQASGAGCVWLLAWEANLRALAFYRKQGFAEVGSQGIDVSGQILAHLVLARSV